MMSIIEGGKVHPKSLFLLLAFLFLPGIGEAQDTSPPNIVMILVDDSALMDFGVYGGEAHTPNIDALAARGAMFTQSRPSPLCSPTRAMLLTGLDNHKTGVATIPEVLPEEQIGKPGYSMALEPSVLTIADRLQDKGYDAPWFEDGVEASLPEDFYSSKFIVDKMVSYLEETSASKPFLAYLPFQAIHIPVQAPPEFTAKYKGRFDEGWHVLRAARHKRAQELGFIRKGAPLAPMPDDAREWDDLDEQTQALYAARMEVNAGMLDAMDHHIGRFVSYLKERGQYENTIFVVTSDNGPEPNRGDHDRRLAMWMKFNGYNIDLDKIGEKGSWGFIGTEWALASASPGSLYKFYATEGGIRAPLIIAGPGIEQSRIHSPAMVTDVAPTLMDMIDVNPAVQSYIPMTGRSLLPVLNGDIQSAYGNDDIRAIEVSGNSALYKGDYKILRSILPVGDGKWRLFNLAEDPGETKDLSAEQPQRLQNMLAHYADYTAEMGVLDMPQGYDSTKQIGKNAVKRMRARHGKFIALIGLIVLLTLIGLVRRLRRKRRIVRQT